MGANHSSRRSPNHHRRSQRHRQNSENTTGDAGTSAAVNVDDREPNNHSSNVSAQLQNTEIFDGMSASVPLEQQEVLNQPQDISQRTDEHAPPSSTSEQQNERFDGNSDDLAYLVFSASGRLAARRQQKPEVKNVAHSLLAREVSACELTFYLSGYLLFFRVCLACMFVVLNISRRPFRVHCSYNNLCSFYNVLFQPRVLWTVQWC